MPKSATAPAAAEVLFERRTLVSELLRDARRFALESLEDEAQARVYVLGDAALFMLEAGRSEDAVTLARLAYDLVHPANR